MSSASTNFKISCDVLILGAGVVGLATGIALLEARPDLRVIIAEKERKIALHASGRNSGVLHAGFYYSPDSLKAKFAAKVMLSSAHWLGNIKSQFVT
jgi:L-2-hydroxyglutarate oxidase LhgO